MSQHSNRADEICAYIEKSPDDLKIPEIDGMVLALLAQYLPDDRLPDYLLYLAVKARAVIDEIEAADRETKH